MCEVPWFVSTADLVLPALCSGASVMSLMPGRLSAGLSHKVNRWSICNTTGTFTAVALLLATVSVVQCGHAVSGRHAGLLTAMALVSRNALGWKAERESWPYADTTCNRASTLCLCLPCGMAAYSGLHQHVKYMDMLGCFWTKPTTCSFAAN